MEEKVKKLRRQVANLKKENTWLKDQYASLEYVNKRITHALEKTNLQLTARGEKDAIRPRENANATFDHKVDPNQVITKLKKMKRSRKDDLLDSINKTDKAMNEGTNEKKSNFNDLSSILILPEDAEEQLQVISDDEDLGILNDSYEK